MTNRNIPETLAEYIVSGEAAGSPDTYRLAILVQNEINRIEREIKGMPKITLGPIRRMTDE